ncbi:hypothetical protein [Amycolatopsis sp. cmx-4-61]
MTTPAALMWISTTDAGHGSRPIALTRRNADALNVADLATSTP